MENKNLLMYFVHIAVSTLVVTAIVTYLYSLLVYGIGAVNWELSIVLAVVLGIVKSIAKSRMHKKTK